VLAPASLAARDGRRSLSNIGLRVSVARRRPQYTGAETSTGDCCSVPLRSSAAGSTSVDASDCGVVGGSKNDTAVLAGLARSSGKETEDFLREAHGTWYQHRPAVVSSLSLDCGSELRQMERGARASCPQASPAAPPGRPHRSFDLTEVLGRNGLQLSLANPQFACGLGCTMRARWRCTRSR
jgi:hypothetical protein